MKKTFVSFLFVVFLLPAMVNAQARPEPTLDEKIKAAEAIEDKARELFDAEYETYLRLLVSPVSRGGPPPAYPLLRHMTWLITMVNLENLLVQKQSELLRELSVFKEKTTELKERHKKELTNFCLALTAAIEEEQNPNNKALHQSTKKMVCGN